MKRGWFCAPVIFLSLLAVTCNEEEGDPPCGSTAAAFTGTWNIKEKCSGAETDYPLTVTENSSGGITLTNLGGGGTTAVVDATISTGSFTIKPKNVQGYIINGNGSLNAGCSQIVFTWAGSPKGSCTCTGTK